MLDSMTESPQQFLYRLMGLKQRVIFESQQPGVEFSYDRRLVQGTFPHTLYQGLNERNTYVRHDIKPFLSDMQASDDFLLEQMTKSMTEEEGRLKRLGAVAKYRPVTVSSARYDHDRQTDTTKPSPVDAELQANRDAIRELTAQVSSLTRHMTLVEKSAERVQSGCPSTSVSLPRTLSADKKGRCHDCVVNGTMSCPHCFVCGQAGHRAIGCLQRKSSGNGRKSLEQGSQ